MTQTLRWAGPVLSGKPAGGYDTGTLAADLAALRDALGHQRFAVAGHDAGVPAEDLVQRGIDHAAEGARHGPVPAGQEREGIRAGSEGRSRMSWWTSR
jgi:pimeloyl-ACP methyl ester carboxylesterase